MYTMYSDLTIKMNRFHYTNYKFILPSISIRMEHLFFKKVAVTCMSYNACTHQTYRSSYTDPLQQLITACFPLLHYF
jgi:hypothetical protein